MITVTRILISKKKSNGYICITIMTRREEKRKLDETHFTLILCKKEILESSWEAFRFSFEYEKLYIADFQISNSISITYFDFLSANFCVLFSKCIIGPNHLFPCFGMLFYFFLTGNHNEIAPILAFDITMHGPVR